MEYPQADYTIIQSGSIDGLIAAVNLKVKTGWRPTGGVLLVGSGIGAKQSFVQALFKIAEGTKSNP